MKNIHILPTDKPSRLCKTDKLRLYPNGVTPKSQGLCKNQNIYITSDEEIKEGDWFIFGVNESVLRMLEAACKANIKYNGAKKIILTTDQDLIKDGVQAIDDEFLEWFVKNPNCEKVEVKCYSKFNDGDFSDYKIFEDKLRHSNKIIIPKEEQKKILVDMMKDDEELGLYDDIEINRIELVCKDCSDSLEDCTCIVSTIDLPRQEIKLEEVFNDEKKENIKKFIDEISNPSQPNQALKDAAERYNEEDLKNAFFEGWIARDGDLPFTKAKNKWFKEFKKK